MRSFIFKDFLIAILDGSKTMTRRPMKNQPFGEYQEYRNNLGYPASAGKSWFGFGNPEDPLYYTPPIQKGEIVYCRETWAMTSNINRDKGWPGRPCKLIDNDPDYCIIYRADGEWQWLDEDGYDTDRSYWRPSIHLSEANARIFLKIHNIKVERLQDISEEDARKEGIELYNNYDGTKGGWDAPTTYKKGFESLWISMYGQESWDKNPWVWCYYSFEKVDRPEVKQ